MHKIQNVYVLLYLIRTEIGRYQLLINGIDFTIKNQKLKKIVVITSNKNLVDDEIYS